MNQRENEGEVDLTRADLYWPGNSGMFGGPGDPNKEVFVEKVVKWAADRYRNWKNRRRNKANF